MKTVEKEDGVQNQWMHSNLVGGRKERKQYGRPRHKIS